MPYSKCKQVKDVRGLSHDNAKMAIINFSCFSSLLVSLDREASEKGELVATGLLKLMKAYNFVHVLTSCLTFYHISVVFQEYFRK